MQIARDPTEWCLVEHRLRSPVFMEQMASAAQEGEGILPHCLVLQGKALFLTACVVSLNALQHRQCRHRIMSLLQVATACHAEPMQRTPSRHRTTSRTIESSRDG